MTLSPAAKARFRLWFLPGRSVYVSPPNSTVMAAVQVKVGTVGRLPLFTMLRCLVPLTVNVPYLIQSVKRSSHSQSVSALSAVLNLNGSRS